MKTEYEVFVEELMEELRKTTGYTEKQVCFAGEGSALAKTGDRILVESAVHDDGVEMCSVYVGEMLPAGGRYLPDQRGNFGRNT